VSINVELRGLGSLSRLARTLWVRRRVSSMGSRSPEGGYIIGCCPPVGEPATGPRHPVGEPATGPEQPVGSPPGTAPPPHPGVGGRRTGSLPRRHHRPTTGPAVGCAYPVGRLLQGRDALWRTYHRPVAPYGRLCYRATTPCGRASHRPGTTCGKWSRNRTVQSPGRRGKPARGYYDPVGGRTTGSRYPVPGPRIGCGIAYGGGSCRAATPCGTTCHRV
jgi:hypothetical protein